MTLSPTELERLSREATAGPWERDRQVISFPRNGKVLPGPWIAETKHEECAALIVYLRNNCEQIAALLRMAGTGLFLKDFQFVPDDQGGHLIAYGKVWRPTDEKPTPPPAQGEGG